MASILARLAVIEQRLGSEPPTPPLTPTTAALETGPTLPASCSKTQAAMRIEMYDTRVKRVPLVELVWARLSKDEGITRGFIWVPSRVCDPTEAASYPYIKFPIPSDEILIEAFNMPVSIGRFFLVKAPLLMPYNHGGNSEVQEWAEHGCRMLERYKQYYDVVSAKMLHARSMETARAFLALALTPRDLGGEVDHEMLTREARLRAEEAAKPRIDIARFALRQSRFTGAFRAGDWVQYEHAVFKRTMRSRVVQVRPGHRYPLLLVSDNIPAIAYPSLPEHDHSCRRVRSIWT
jgi:hypothetical protein